MVGELVGQPQLAAGRLLACRDEDGRVAAEGSRVPTEDEVRAWLAAMADARPPARSR